MIMALTMNLNLKNGTRASSSLVMKTVPPKCSQKITNHHACLIDWFYVSVLALGPIWEY
jgi:hypothetical protein